MEIKTSETSPIRVDFVDEQPLGLTFAPGKRGPARLGSYIWRRTLSEDLDRLRDHYEVDCIVSLLEEHELELLQIAGLRQAIRERGMTSHWHPIVDGDVPDEIGPFMATIRTIISSLRTGERVVLHCRGGLGRAGTVASCVLVALGDQPDRAIEKVRAARPRAVENATQEAFVEQFAALWEERGNSPSQ